MKFNNLLAPAVIASASLAGQAAAFPCDERVCQVTVFYPGKETGTLMPHLMEPEEPIVIPKINGKRYYAVSDANCKYKRYDVDPEGNPWPSGLRVKGVAVKLWKEKLD